MKVYLIRVIITIVVQIVIPIRWIFIDCFFKKI